MRWEGVILQIKVKTGGAEEIEMTGRNGMESGGERCGVEDLDFPHVFCHAFFMSSEAGEDRERADDTQERQKRTGLLHFFVIRFTFFFCQSNCLREHRICMALVLGLGVCFGSGLGWNRV